jgi:hypothetical protein
LYLGFNDQQREFTTGDYSPLLPQTVSASISQREKVEALRNCVREAGRSPLPSAKRRSRRPNLCAFNWTFLNLLMAATQKARTSARF